MPLNDLLTSDSVIPSLRVNGKKQALQELSDRAAAVSGLAAREIFEREPPFGLLLSDIVLAGMNGVELAAKIQGLQPSIRVLFMPGYQREHRVGPSQLLAKPFANDELLAKLESTLADLPASSS